MAASADAGVTDHAARALEIPRMRARRVGEADVCAGIVAGLANAGVNRVGVMPLLVLDAGPITLF